MVLVFLLGLFIGWWLRMIATTFHNYRVGPVTLKGEFREFKEVMKTLWHIIKRKLKLRK